MKVGKTAAFALGGGIIILQVAQTQGYIKIDWDKFKKKASNATDIVEEKIYNEASNWVEQVRYWRKVKVFCTKMFLMKRVT